MAETKDKSISPRFDDVLNRIIKNDIPRSTYLKLIDLHASDYFFLGIALGMNYDNIKAIRNNHPNDCKMALSELIFEHFVKHDNYTPRDLFNSLKENAFDRTAYWLIDEFERCLRKQ